MNRPQQQPDQRKGLQALAMICASFIINKAIETYPEIYVPQQPAPITTRQAAPMVAPIINDQPAAILHTIPETSENAEDILGLTNYPDGIGHTRRKTIVKVIRHSSAKPYTSTQKVSVQRVAAAAPAKSAPKAVKKSKPESYKVLKGPQVNGTR